MKIENYDITFFKGSKKSKLVIFIHENKTLVEKIYKNVKRAKPTIICIDGADWNADFSPVATSMKMFGKNTIFSGNASRYLLFFKNTIFPKCLKELGITNENEYRLCIAGYSLAGLFSVYSIFNSDLFTYCLSCSSSLWFPHFVDSIKSKKVSCKLEFAYFSLGDQEELSKDENISKVNLYTDECIKILKEQKIKTLFKSNSGGHFKEVELRILKAINELIRIDKVLNSSIFIQD